MFESSIALETACRAVNGGATTTSTLSRTIDTIPRSSRTSVSASPTVLFIFQLPATMGRLAMRFPFTSRAPQRLGAAARRDVAHLLGQAHLLDGSGAIPSAHYRRRARIGRHRPSDRPRALGELVDL